ncbi:MAG: flagellar motor protein MotA, partial [Brevundimonas sp.]
MASSPALAQDAAPAPTETPAEATADAAATPADAPAETPAPADAASDDPEEVGGDAHGRLTVARMFMDSDPVVKAVMIGLV